MKAVAGVCNYLGLGLLATILIIGAGVDASAHADAARHLLQKTCTPPSGTLPGANAWDCKTSTCGCGISQGQFCHTTCKDGFYLSFADVKFPVLRAFLEKKIKGPIFICTPLFFGCPTNILVGKCVPNCKKPGAPPCSDGRACSVGTCTDNGCEYNPVAKDSKVCRESAGTCDVEEKCDGYNLDCPKDEFASATTPCTGTKNNGPCDGMDLCDGNGNCVDKFLGAEKTCRDAVDVCDVAEVCDGKQSDCPKDEFASATTPCTGTKNDGPCDGIDLCDGKGKCEDKFLGAEKTCREAAGCCDVPEVCPGGQSACPDDDFKPANTPCVGPVAENTCTTDISACTGYSAECPAYTMMSAKKVVAGTTVQVP